MFKGIGEFFSGKPEVKNDAESVYDKESKQIMKLGAFSKMFPEIGFTTDNLEQIIKDAGLTQEEIDNILSLALNLEPEFPELNVEDAGERLMNASKIAA